MRIRYRTSASASALQWLQPSQTAGGVHPFVFSQCQAIHARSLVPLQDTPRVRIRYQAELDVPAPLRALMAAESVGRTVDEANGRAREKWRMPQPIPPYLLAFAVGALESRELGPRSRVWAEPSTVEAAAREFADVDRMLTTAERLFGAYAWDRFDLLVMPPSFPYGGMENPRLTFLTPTLIAGDRSLVSVVAHELAHAWTGNLVTNADAEHFWLNEGFTVFAERRIVEALYGADVCALQAALGAIDLADAVARFRSKPELTHLETRLAGIDPDEVFSEIPYEKGYLFLRTLEEKVGRAAFDRFLARYVERFRFRAITTSDFERLAEEELPGALQQVNAEAWLRGPGVPENAPRARSERLERLQRLGDRLPTDEEARAFLPIEWQLYLERLPRPSTHARALDERFHLSGSRNYEIVVSWLGLALASHDEKAVATVENVLGSVGRMKYLKPLYAALMADPQYHAVARRCFQRFRDRYHPIAQQVIEWMLR